MTGNSKIHEYQPEICRPPREDESCGCISEKEPCCDTPYERGRVPVVRVLTPVTSATDYERLVNKPKIEGVELVGNKTYDELNLSPIGARSILELF